MEVVIECDTHAIGCPCVLQNLGVIRRPESNLRDVNGIPAALAQESCNCGSKSLVQENTLDATRGGADQFVVKSSCGVMKSLLKIFELQKRIFRQDGRLVAVNRNQFEHPTYGDA